jgi:hypothetical protein
MYGEEGLTFFENGMFGEEGELMRILPFLESPVSMALLCCIGFIAIGVAFLVPLFIVLKVCSIESFIIVLGGWGCRLELASGVCTFMDLECRSIDIHLLYSFWTWTEQQIEDTGKLYPIF